MKKHIPFAGLAFAIAASSMFAFFPTTHETSASVAEAPASAPIHVAPGSYPEVLQSSSKDQVFRQHFYMAPPKVTTKPTHPAAVETAVANSPAPTQHVATTTPAPTHTTVHHAAPAKQASNAHDSLYWLAHAIEAEAGGESMDVKIAVGDVIMNRTHSADYPSTVQGVIFQISGGHYAFTSVENGWIYNAPSNDSWTAAREVLYGHKNIVPSALVFYNDSQTPAGSWVRKRPVIETIGHMTFAQ